MMVTRLKLKNWRNFRDVDVSLRDKTYLIGPNASGKSNFLDVFRFLKDVSKPSGGGLQKAIEERGGIKKLRCLHARQDNEVLIEVHLSNSADDMPPDWKYVLGFKPEGKGKQRILVTQERVVSSTTTENKIILRRPNKEDNKDSARLTQTFLEQINTNSEFREIADFFGNLTYLHLVPQLLKHGNKIGGNRLEDDPFGQSFLERIAKCRSNVRDSRLKKIGKALQLAVPRFEEIRFHPDEVTGQPHLEARYGHHRPNAGWQREDQFSDGTLRLLGLLWSLLDGDSLLLLEEPELSLNDSIVEQIPLMMQRIQRTMKNRRQIFISTHSEALLSNPGIDGRGILILETLGEGTRIRSTSEEELSIMEIGMSPAELLFPKVKPKEAEQLGMFE